MILFNRFIAVKLHFDKAQNVKIMDNYYYPNSVTFASVRRLKTVGVKVANSAKTLACKKAENL